MGITVANSINFKYWKNDELQNYYKTDVKYGLKYLTSRLAKSFDGFWTDSFNFNIFSALKIETHSGDQTVLEGIIACDQDCGSGFRLNRFWILRARRKKTGSASAGLDIAYAGQSFAHKPDPTDGYTRYRMHSWQTYF